MLRTLINVLLGLISALSVTAVAQQESACILWVDHLKPLNGQLTAWFSAAGYTVKDLNNPSAQNVSDLAKLLNTHTFYARQEGAKILFHETTVEPTADWVPLIVSLTEQKLQKNSASYQCTNVLRNLKMIASSRELLLQGWRVMAQPDKKWPFSWGHFFLEREHDYLVRNGVKTASLNEAFARYDQLLADFNNTLEPGSNLFSNWTKIKQLLYSKEKRDISYCRDSTMIHDVLYKRCTNCVGFTALFVALVADGHLTMTVGWDLAFQSFSDHVRPVLISKKTNRVFDLSSGLFSSLKDPTYKASDLLLLVLKRSQSFLLPHEVNIIRNINVSPINSVSWTCLPGIDTGYLLRNQLFNFTGLLSCRRFSSKDPPEKAEMTDMIEVTGEEPDAEPSAWSTLFHLIKSDFDAPISDSRRMNLTEAQAIANEKIANFLNSDEQTLYHDAIKSAYATNEFLAKFSAKKLIARFGLSVADLTPPGQPYLHLNDASASDALPAFVPTLSRDDLPKSCASFPYIGDNGSNTYFIESSDKNFPKKMSNLPLIDRYVYILNEIQNDLNKYRSNPKFMTQAEWDIFDPTVRTQKQAQIVCAYEIQKELSELSNIYLTYSIGGVFSWTGAIARHLLRENIFKPLYDEIKTLGRRQAQSHHEYLARLNQLDDENLESVLSLVFQIRNIQSISFFPVESEPLDGLLSHTLEDPDFFYTVEPTKDEQQQLTHRPYFPQLKGEVQKLLTPARTDKINLPIWTNVKCEPGSQFIELGSIVVDCRTRNQTTDVVGAKGSLVGSTEGRDAVSEPAANVNLKDLQNLAFEYRAEIDLRPKVWAILFTGASQDFLDLGRTLMLVHYMWRNRLDNELESMALRGYQVVNPSGWKIPFEDQESPCARVVVQQNLLSDISQFDQKVEASVREWEEQGEMSTKPLYVQTGLPYFRLAFQDLVKTKHDFVLFETTRFYNRKQGIWSNAGFYREIGYTLTGSTAFRVLKVLPFSADVCALPTFVKDEYDFHPQSRLVGHEVD